jgi:hypothetical protein
LGAFLRALFAAVLRAWRDRQRDHERDVLVEKGAQDDARIADQAAALDALRRANDVPQTNELARVICETWARSSPTWAGEDTEETKDQIDYAIRSRKAVCSA